MRTREDLIIGLLILSLALQVYGLFLHTPKVIVEHRYVNQGREAEEPSGRVTGSTPVPPPPRDEKRRPQPSPLDPLPPPGEDSLPPR